MEQTLCIIKPDAASSSKALADIFTDLLDAGFTIVKATVHKFTPEEVEEFYAEHVGKDYFQAHKDFMTSGHSVVFLLEKNNAISDYRKMMGFYDPAKAEPGTLRNKYGTNSPKNAVHGSDSPESAAREIAFFF